MIYYRISDNSYPKVKLPGASKKVCWENFYGIFKDHPIEVIADRCSEKTLSFLKEYPLKKIHETYFGNAGSFLYALDLATGLPDGEVVYMVEDDYIHHHEASMDLIREGLIRSDYATLFDHPDKYSGEYGYGEVCKVYRTNGSHWRHSVSTCMTFASLAEKFREDYFVWKKWLRDAHPHDHHIFTELGGRGRKLGVSIPGRAVHIDPTWGGLDKIEPWAVKLVWDYYGKITEPSFVECREYVDSMNVPLLDKLKMASGCGSITY